jgi:DNA-binding NtrC family response regulator
LLSSELFGVEGKADAATSQARPGKLELASGGTLLLEEVGALPMDLQTDLLRAIENGSALRSGGLRPVAIDVRLIVTSNSDLTQTLSEGRFRADLYHRLSGIAIAVPPLRNRTDDLLLLQDRILNTLCQRVGKQVVLAPDALEAMRAYGWPGNVRELEVMLEQVLHSTEKSVLSAADLGWAATAGEAKADAPRLQESQVEAERIAILRAGRETGGHIGRTANMLQISRTTLWRKMRQHGIEREQLR